MDKIGFIGYGHMGSVIVKSLLSAGYLLPHQVIISTRIKTKLNEIKTLYPDIHIAENNREVACKSSTLFLCVGTYQVHSVLTEIRAVLPAETHLITISGGLEMACIEQLFDGAVTKMMPTLISEVKEGVTLLCHNSKVSAKRQADLIGLMQTIGEVKLIAEHQFETGADFTSCAPGLFAAMCDQFVRAGVKSSDFSYQEATEMLLRTLYGTAKLLLRNREDFQTLIKRVATPGGATEGGVAVLETKLPEIYDQVFSITRLRHEARKQRTRQDFGMQED